MLISVLKVVGNTAADGPGLRTSVYLAGCIHHCPGCHNPESWKRENGTEIEIDDLIAEIESYGNKKVTITGGDPFFQYIQLSALVMKLSKLGYNIWIYTGYTLEELQKGLYTKNLYSVTFQTICRLILAKVDAIVDGPFIENLRDTGLRFRGSSNQRILDPKTGKELEGYQ